MAPGETLHVTRVSYPETCSVSFSLGQDHTSHVTPRVTFPVSVPQTPGPSLRSRLRVSSEASKTAITTALTFVRPQHHRFNPHRLRPPLIVIFAY